MAVPRQQPFRVPGVGLTYAAIGLQQAVIGSRGTAAKCNDKARTGLIRETPVLHAYTAWRTCARLNAVVGYGLNHGLAESFAR
jgi:hypothetical protein